MSGLRSGDPDPTQDQTRNAHRKTGQPRPVQFCENYPECHTDYGDSDEEKQSASATSRPGTAFINLRHVAMVPICVDHARRTATTSWPRRHRPATPLKQSDQLAHTSIVKSPIEFIDGLVRPPKVLAKAFSAGFQRMSRARPRPASPLSSTCLS